jgi:peptidoglycan/LPS O-acetylase OafA/YrhL
VLPIDGLRGLAALFVVCHHSSLLLFSWSIHHPWTSAETSRLIQFPVLRLLVSGLPHVAIFFVISGYSISLKTLRHAHKREHAAGAAALASSVCRRHSRLFIPAATVSFIAACWSHWGWYPAETWHEVVAIGTRAPPRDAESLLGQLLDWFRHLLVHMDPTFHNVNGIDGFAYDLNQWTMPVEFAGSIIVFLLLAAFSRFSPVLRLVMTAGVLAWNLHITSYAPFLFVGGMFLADLSVFLKSRTKSNLAGKEMVATEEEEDCLDVILEAKPNRSVAWAVFKHSLVITAFLFALYLLSMPEMNGAAGGFDPAPGYRTLASLIPQQYWDAGRPDYLFIPLAAFFLVGAVDRSPEILQRIFTTGFAQYMGRISFSLYLVHGPVLYTLAARLSPSAMAAVGGGNTDAQWAGGVALVGAAFTVVVVWYADLVSRLVDEKTVVFVKKVWDFLTRG